MEEKRIHVEISGDKLYLTEKELQRAIEQTEEARNAMVKLGIFNRKEAEELFSLRILKEE